jgi:hypothetical protein
VIVGAVFEHALRAAASLMLEAILPQPAAVAVRAELLDGEVAEHDYAAEFVATGAVVVLASLPFAARAYLVNRGVFRLRVTVEDPHGMPVDEAKVTSSIGGEPKKVDGGWEFDIPQGNKPTDGKLTIYAEVRSAFLTGKSDVVLGDDYNLAAKVRLDHDRSAHIRGRVLDRKQIPIAGALVSIVGYESEALKTGALGQFDTRSCVRQPVDPDFFVTNLETPSRAVVRFYNKRGTAEQWIKEGKQAVKMTRLSCHRFRSNQVRLGNLWRRLGLPRGIENWSLTSLQQRLVKTGGRLVKHARYYWLLLAEGHLTRRRFGAMLGRIALLPVPTG